jgi:hypothetical protein
MYLSQKEAMPLDSDRSTNGAIARAQITMTANTTTRGNAQHEHPRAGSAADDFSISSSITSTIINYTLTSRRKPGLQDDFRTTLAMNMQVGIMIANITITDIEICIWEYNGDSAE